MSAFPAIPVQFYDILQERLRANHITDTRLIEAVNHVIDTCHFPTPTIADIIDFDGTQKMSKERIAEAEYIKKITV